MWTFIKEKIKIYYNSLRRVCQRYILAERVILKTYLIINTFWSLLFWNKSRQAIKYEYNSQIYFSYIYDCKLKEDDRYLWQIFFCWAAFLFSNVFNVSKKTFDDFLKVIPCFYLELEPAWYKLHGTSPFKDISSYNAGKTDDLCWLASRNICSPIRASSLPVPAQTSKDFSKENKLRKRIISLK